MALASSSGKFRHQARSHQPQSRISDHQQAYNLAANGRTARTEMPAPELLLVVRQEHMRLICGSYHLRCHSLLSPFLLQFLRINVCLRECTLSDANSYWLSLEESLGLVLIASAGFALFFSSVALVEEFVEWRRHTEPPPLKRLLLPPAS